MRSDLMAYFSHLSCTLVPSKLKWISVPRYTNSLHVTIILEGTMLQKLVEITSHHPELLSSLVKAKQVPPYIIIEREYRFYLSFLDANVLLSTEKAEQS